MRKPPHLLGALLIVCANAVHAEVVEYKGNPAALSTEKFVHAVSEARSPVQQVYVKAKDGVYIATAIRKPQGDGPFPAIVIFHGAPGGRGMEQLVGWSRGDHGGPVWERFLQEGFVVIVADYRGGERNAMNRPSTTGLITAIDDGVSVIEHAQAQPYVDAKRISLYGVSLGGNLVLYLAAKVPSLHAVIAGAPAPIWFLGYDLPADGSRPDFAVTPPDASVSKGNIAPIQTPILIQVGTEDRLLALDKVLHDELTRHGKPVRLEVYEHGYHDFVLGPQGQKRPDLPEGEKLMQGALDALERSVRFAKERR